MGKAEWVWVFVTQKWGKTRVAKEREKKGRDWEETVLVREKASTCRWALPFVVLGVTVPFLKAILLSWLGDQPWRSHCRWRWRWWWWCDGKTLFQFSFGLFFTSVPYLLPFSNLLTLIHVVILDSICMLMANALPSRGVFVVGFLFFLPLFCSPFRFSLKWMNVVYVCCLMELDWGERWDSSGFWQLSLWDFCKWVWMGFLKFCFLLLVCRISGNW